MFTKKIFLSIVLVLGSLSLIPSAAQAHALETNGSVGAVLHIDPEDDPIVGQPATFFLEFKDKDNKFTIQTCDCQVMIKQGDKEIFSTQLGDATFAYTFPERAIYTLIINGRPKQPDQFTAFTLTYDLRVDRTADTPVEPENKLLAQDHTLHYILFGIGFAVIGLLYLKDKYKSRKLNQ